VPPPFHDWAAAGFVSAAPTVEAREVGHLVPLGGDYWFATQFPITSADHVLRRPESLSEGEPVYVGPLIVTDDVLSFAFTGGRVRLLAMSPNTITVTVNPNAGERIHLPNGHWSEPVPDATAVDRDGRAVVRVEQTFLVDTGLQARGSGPVPVRVSWDVSGLRGEQVLLLFEPGSLAVVAHEDRLFWPHTPRDRAAPVWGFADMHCHPMAAKGFGGGLIAGDYEPSLASAADLPRCNQPRGTHQPHFRDIGDFVANNWPDAHPTGGSDGGRSFANWPNFMDGIHQQMHPEWIRRAHAGGLRLMVALVVHTRFMATQHVVYPELEHDDLSVTERQVQYWRDVCAANADLMAIALTPAAARSIIAAGRIAVVLGLEVDSAFATSMSYDDMLRAAADRLRRPWWSRIGPGRSRGRRPPSPRLDEPMLDTLRTMAREQLARLWDLGIRQLNPVHLADNAVGYASVYEEAFNLSMVATFGTQFDVAAASDVDFRLGEERDTLTYAVAGVFDFYTPHWRQWEPVGRDEHGNKVMGHVNNGLGLTPYGRIAIEELIRHGFIIDVDHMSRATAAHTLAMAEGAADAWSDGLDHPPYPLVSAHASFRDLSPRRKWGDENNPGVGQRAFEHIWPHESEKTAAQLESLRGVGGLVAAITSHIDSLQHQRPDGSTPVANDCAGTTKTWAQELMYAVDAMHGDPVGVGTDMALLREIGPRFGPQAAYGLTDEHLDSARLERRRQALAQDRGVRYDRPGDLPPFWTPPEVNAEWKHNPYILPQDSPTDSGFGDRAAFATAVWTAMAIYVSGGNGRPARDDANEILQGLRASSAEEAQRVSDRARTAWEIWNHHPVTHVGSDPRSDFHLINDAMTMWHRMSGPNALLSRCRTGDRDWDFNTDGLAHYGLLPDMLQDLANVGLPSDVMSALFGSAEAYIGLWERCERWNTSIRPHVAFSTPVADTARIPTSSAAKQVKGG
jgi:microsomal dipeptidase-like Zn-dependent dipeptidase